MARLDQDVLADTFVFGHDKQHAVLFKQTPDHTRVFVFEHLDDRGFAAAAPVNAGFAHQHTVAVEHLVHLLRPEEQIFTFIVRHQKTEAVGVSLHAPGAGAFPEIFSRMMPGAENSGMANAMAIEAIMQRPTTISLALLF